MKTIPLTKGYETVVDDEAYRWLKWFSWHAHKSAHNVYAATMTKMNGKRQLVYMHRVIADCPEGKVVHHQDRNSLNNRAANLENCNKSDNLSYRKWR